MIIKHTGGSALSAFQLQKKLTQLQACAPGVTALTAQFVYWIDVTAPLNDEENARLAALLQESKPLTQSPSGVCWVVTPRVGTCSPWSSKATDILQQAGLSQVLRVERGMAYHVQGGENLQAQAMAGVLFDPMTQTLWTDAIEPERLFSHYAPETLATVPVLSQGLPALVTANENLGLALSDDELSYLHTAFTDLQRDPTDVELMMFAQANSEHCRHKIFKARWTINGEEKPHSLFGMIQHTYHCYHENVLSAYHDNGAVLAGQNVARFMRQGDNQYRYEHEPVHLVIKVETHNHPTAIAPFAGAATGSGGEIRDEGAVGRGAKPKMGLTGYSVSNLHIPGYEQPWEQPNGKPAHMASALDIMLEAPLGGASFNNEFGRPNLCGYFRTYERKFQQGPIRGYHKPIMIAGGLGNIRPQHVDKEKLPVGAKIIVLGGPAMLIGLGGGAASSLASSHEREALDFASVQRSNPEMQRRAQEVIDTCWALGEGNPILAIHDVGAGGLSNAVPELLHDSGRGGVIDLRAIPNAEPSMSPLAVWCNEAQERYVLGIAPESVAQFAAIAERERCLYAVIGEATLAENLVLQDKHFKNNPIDIPLALLFGNAPTLVRHAKTSPTSETDFSLAKINWQEAVERVLQLPAVADKTFLITIGDRSITGMVARDQMVGPWQVPVADCAVTTQSFSGYAGEAMAMGERAPLAVTNYQAAARMAVAEAITNIAAAPIVKLQDIKLSANWMAAANHSGEDAGLYAAVEAVGMELCPALGLAIPVGKDSLSMATKWQENNETKEVVSPLSLVISAFAPVTDVRRTQTPLLSLEKGAADLLFIDLAKGRQRLGGSALSQCFNEASHITPDVVCADVVKNFFAAIQSLNQQGLLIAYHDRSDGGLLVTLLEMAFCSHVGLDIDVGALGHDPLAALFNEELGAVIQVQDKNRALQVLSDYQLHPWVHCIAHINDSHAIRIEQNRQLLYHADRKKLHQHWSAVSFQMQRLRDNPACADMAYEVLGDEQDKGLPVLLTFNPAEDISAPLINRGVKPVAAIFREQGVNGHIEMAAAFHAAGFQTQDVHMTDLLSGRFNLNEAHLLAACGGFSYGDVLGAGSGWAKSILFHEALKAQFAEFFADPNRLSLGVCNGCQLLSHLKSIIPGAAHWPQFVRNKSEQFEARLVAVSVEPSPSLLLKGMEGAKLPIVVAHGEGRVQWENPQDSANTAVCLRYIDNQLAVTERYPSNPNGSFEGVASICNNDGRITLMMPHPERVFRSVQFSWYPETWGEEGPWLRLFKEAAFMLGN